MASHMVQQNVCPPFEKGGLSLLSNKDRPSKGGPVKLMLEVAYE